MKVLAFDRGQPVAVSLAPPEVRQWGTLSVPRSGVPARGYYRVILLNELPNKAPEATA